MKICFVLNDIATEKDGTSNALMAMAHQRGHEVFAMGVGDFNFHHDRPITVNCTQPPKNLKTKSTAKFLEALQGPKAVKKQIDCTTLDVVFIRNNPTEEDGRQWAEQAGVAFGRMIQQLDVLVLNDAYALSHAFIDKLYFEELPSEIKPASIITRDKDQLLDFWEKQGKKMVLKPLEGSGGQDVYLIDEHEKNVNQIIDHLSSQGYVIAQEFLPAVKDGDVRVLLLNGKVMEKMESEIIDPHTGNYIRDLYDHIIQISENIEIYREMIWGLMDMYMTTISNKMNEVMKVLTIMASIFIPLTFIAGIYGMNFEYIPELQWKYSYFVLWGFIIFLLMLYYFKRKKWL